MSRYTFGVLIIRIFVPMLIALSTSIRPSLMSMIYLAMLCYLPFINLIEERNVDAGTFKYAMIFLPYQTAATQLGFYLYTLSTDEIDLPENDDLKHLLKNVGLSSLHEASATDIFCWVGPEVIMFIVSALYTSAIKMMAGAEKLKEKTTDEDELEDMAQEKLKYLQFSVSAGKLITICLLLTAALWRHSLFGVFYFLLFLFLMTVWSLDRNLRRLLCIVLFLCVPVNLLHIAFQYSYQIEMVQDTYPSNNTVLRYLGIDTIVEVGPQRGSGFTYYKYNVNNIFNLSYPIITYLLYYFMVLEASMLNSLDIAVKEERRKQFQGRWRRIGKKVKSLVRGDKQLRPKAAFLFTLPDRRENEKYDKFMNIVESLASLVTQYSYVGAIVIMMIWSVMFINVGSFLLLVWGILLWMIPNRKTVTQFSAMLMCCYAYVNMTYTYMLGMDVKLLTIPWIGSMLNIFQFVDIGREISLEVLVKVLYTVMFWVTIRRYFQEKRFEGRITKASKSDVDESFRKTGVALLMERILSNFLVKYWMVGMACVMFVNAITGRQMNVFRILNMFQYLAFMVLLQLSFRLWRLLLYPYLLFLVFTSLMTMFMGYLYEFQEVQEFLDEHLGLSEDLQAELDLRRIDSRREYVIRIIAPTLYIVMCLIQLTFFYKPFMSITDPENAEAAQEEDEVQKLYGPRVIAMLDFGRTLLLIMEQHLLKAVILVLFLMCIYDQCALYFLILGPLCISMILGRYCQLAVIYFAAVVVSAHTMLRMIYALSFFSEDDWNVTCNTTKHPTIHQLKRNVALWVGFWKYRNDKMTLLRYLMWPTLFVLASSGWTVVTAKLYTYRRQRRWPSGTPNVIFPDVSYRTADHNLRSYVKYSLNYGFYRLGYELSLIMLAIVIAYRQDGYSIIYSIWLCVLLIVPRFILRYTWWIFVLFLAVIIPFQYIVAIGLPPQWCIEHEWERGGYFWISAQDFWFLPDNYRSLPIDKVIPEFVLLMLSSYQLHNFVTELRHRGSEYDGGSNDSVVDNFERPGFENPLPDFTTYTRSYLDVFKRLFFTFSYWGSIWIVFLGSVNRSNIFSIVYLFYVFAYIWFGINLYYQPLKTIKKYWDHLIAQNVFILTTKSCVQIVGCFYMHLIPKEYCHLVKLLAIGCVRRFSDKAYFKKMDQARGMCESTDDELFGITWDAAIFAFLIIQRRVFSSYNYFHMIDEAKASHVLSMRGAQIMEEYQDKEIKAMKDEYKRVNDRITAKMKRIQDKEAKILGAYYKNSRLNHKMAIRSGDYTTFEDQEVDVEAEPGQKEKEAAQKKARRRNNITLMTDLFEQDLRYAVRNYWDNSEQQVAKKVNKEEEEYTWINKVVYFFRFVWANMDVIVVSTTNLLNKYTERYITINNVLEKEKRELKEKTDYQVGVRVEGWWLPRGSYESLLKNSRLARPKRPPKEISTEEKSNVVKLFNALCAIVVAKSDQLSYLFVILNQIILSELIIIPQSLMVWLWGSLSNPRPSKTFWIIMIGYVELTLLLKCIFQYDEMPGNTVRKKVYYKTKMGRVNPFYPPRFFGLFRSELYYLYEMLTLMVVMIHRTYLKNMGLWTTLKSSRVKLEGDYVVENGMLVPIEQGKGGDKALTIKSTKSSALDNITQSIATIFIQYAEAFRAFHQRLLLHVSRKAVDLYTMMFMCDFMTFLIVTFGYPDFFEKSEEGDSVWSFLTSSAIPIMFTLVVFAHFLLMITDRCIYLKRNVLAKLTFQIMQVIYLHLWLFFLLPMWTDGRLPNQVVAPALYYLFKCFYLLISAYQIRCGYPARIWGFSCCKKFGIVNYCLYKTYMLLPFLLEIRVLLDWLLTDTSMSLFDWWKMENIYTEIYNVKCQRAIESDYQSQPGVKRRTVYKYFWGVTFLFIILFIVWFPLMLYSFAREAGKSNVPASAKLTVIVGDVEPLYENNAYIDTFTRADYDQMKNVYNAYPVPQMFLDTYDHDDVACMVFATGGAVWMIREQIKDELIKHLQGVHPAKLQVKYSIVLKHEDNEKSVEDGYELYLYPHSTRRTNLVKMMEGDTSVPHIVLNYVVPKFLKVEQRGRATPLDLLMKEIPDHRASVLRNLSLKAHSSTGTDIWWEVREEVGDYNFLNILDQIAYGDGRGSTTVYSFSDKIVSTYISLLTGGGILALYGLYFLFLKDMVRNVALDTAHKAWINEAPQLDTVYLLVKEVYLCRTAGFWEYEELAFARLSFVMRSREFMIKLCRYEGDPYNPQVLVLRPPMRRY